MLINIYFFTSDEMEKSIIYFLGLYAPENIVGTVFAITDTPINPKYDTQELADARYIYDLKLEYTEQDIKECLGNEHRDIIIHTNATDDNSFYIEYNNHYLTFIPNEDYSSISKTNKNTLADDDFVTDILREVYHIDDTRSEKTEYISTRSIFAYHKYICTKDGGWYGNYYRKHGINPAISLLDKILNRIEDDRYKFLYLLVCLVVADDTFPDVIKVDNDISDTLNSIYLRVVELLQI